MISTNQISSPTHITISVRGVNHSGNVATSDAEECNGSPTSEEGEEQEETENICTGSLGDGTVGVISVRVSIRFTRIPLHFYHKVIVK